MDDMDTIAFNVRESEEAGHRYSWVDIRVNGVLLPDLLRDVEMEHLGGREPSVAGKYEGLWAADVLPPSRHYWGDPKPLYEAGYGRVMVMGCSCGEAGCWPLECNIEVGPEVVVWSSFRNPHLSEYEYEGVGPFRFSRAEYESALRTASESLRPSGPRP